jgi:hypothetical protein
MTIIFTIISTAVLAFVVGRSRGKAFVINKLIGMSFIYPNAKLKEALEESGVTPVWFEIQRLRSNKIERQ